MDENAAALPCPPGAPWKLMDDLADYMRRRFFEDVRPLTRHADCLPCIDIPVEILCEAERMVELLLRARKNPSN